jgi:hypothetical protein
MEAALAVYFRERLRGCPAPQLMMLRRVSKWMKSLAEDWLPHCGGIHVHIPRALADDAATALESLQSLRRSLAGCEIIVHYLLSLNWRRREHCCEACAKACVASSPRLTLASIAAVSDISIELSLTVGPPLHRTNARVKADRRWAAETSLPAALAGSERCRALRLILFCCSARRVAAVLESFPHITSLKISAEDTIHGTDVPALAPPISRMTRLTALCFQPRTLTRSGSSLVNEFKTTSLTKLSIASNGLDDPEVLAAMIAKNPRLTAIDLSNNYIPALSSPLATALAGLTGLVKLDLSDNEPGPPYAGFAHNL